jgi:RNA polymerase sigma factor (sigma-70 family)
MQKYDYFIESLINKTLYMPSVLDKEDLRQVAAMAIIEAQKKFNSSISDNRDGYIYTSIRRAIQNEASKFYNVFSGDHKKTAKLRKVKMARFYCPVESQELLSKDNDFYFIINEIFQSELEKKIFELRFLNGLSRKEIKNQTGLAVSKIKKIDINIKKKLSKI